MAITGLVGFRCLKFLQGHWVSASQSGFVWDSPLVYSACPHCRKDKWGHVLIAEHCSCGIHATIWPDEFTDYMFDTSAIGFLVEAIGHIVGRDHRRFSRYVDGEILAHTWKHSHGFTSSGVLVVGVVNWTTYDQPEFVPLEDRVGYQYHDGYTARVMTRKALLMEQAAKFFKVDILDYQTARLVAKTMWERQGFTWPIEENL